MSRRRNISYREWSENRKVFNIAVKGDTIVRTERPLHGNEYHSRLELSIDLCSDDKLIPQFNDVIKQIKEYSEIQGINEPPYLYSHGELVISFEKSECNKKQIFSLEKTNINELSSFNKVVSIKGKLGNVLLDKKMLNKYDRLHLEGQKINSIPFEGKINIADLNVEANDVDLDFVKNIDFSPSNDLSRPDHYYTNGIDVYALSDDPFYRPTIFAKEKCRVFLPNDLSNAEYFRVRCDKVSTKKLRGKIRAINLKRLQLERKTGTKKVANKNAIKILSSLEDLSTIEFLDKDYDVSVISFNNKLVSVKNINRLELGLLWLRYADLRGFPYEQFTHLVRNTAPASYGEYRGTFRTTDENYKIEELDKAMEKCWHCVSPYISCKADDYAEPKYLNIIQESDIACREAFNMINEPLGDILLKVKNNQPINANEKFFIEQLDLRRYESLFEDFDFEQIENKEIRDIVKDKLKEISIKGNDKFKVLL